MKYLTPELRKKTHAWIGRLFQHSAQKSASVPVLASDLKEVVSPVLGSMLEKSDFTAPDYSKLPESGVKPGLSKWLRSPKVRSKLQGYYTSCQVLEDLSSDSNSPELTIGDLIRCWVWITEQDPELFVARLGPRIDAICSKFFSITGHLDLSDAGIQSDPEAASTFVQEFIVCLVEVTPDSNLAILRRNLFTWIQNISIGDLATSLDIPLGQACKLMTFDLSTNVGKAIDSNPVLGQALADPLLDLIIEKQAGDNGWQNNYPSSLGKIMSTLKPEFEAQNIKMNTEAADSIISGLAKRDFFANLASQIDGSLKARFTQAIADLTKGIRRAVESVWEFADDTSESVAIGIENWLLRREA